MAAIVGSLHFFFASGCALETRAGDGLVTQGEQVTVNPTLMYPKETIDSGVPEGTDFCKAKELFQQKVVPHFIKRCYECHDGTSGKAALSLSMQVLMTDLATSCTYALLFGASEADKTQAAILTSSDPGRPDKDHEFKYEDLAEFQTYRNDVLTWLNAEKP